MSAMSKIQNEIGKLSPDERAALAAWLQSQEEPVMSKTEEAALLVSLDKAARELDAGQGQPIEVVRERLQKWTTK
jgi:hypothetical protein